MNAEDRFETMMQLQRAGVGAQAADRLIEAAESDPLLVLAIIPMPQGPRVGDRLSTMAPGSRRTLRVEAIAEGRRVPDTEKSLWGVVGLPVSASGADDVQVAAPVRKAAG